MIFFFRKSKLMLSTERVCVCEPGVGATSYMFSHVWTDQSGAATFFTCQTISPAAVNVSV